MSAGLSNEKIIEAINSGKPFMVARLGSVEIKPTLYFSTLEKVNLLERIRLFIIGDIDYIFDKGSYINYMGEIMSSNAGFFPKREVDLRTFSNMMIDSIKEIDICGAWLNEYLLLDRFNAAVSFCKLSNLEPYDYETPWSQALKGKRVLVVHPFAESIERQYARREEIWLDKEVLPEFDLITIKAVQSVGGSEIPFRNWFDALDYMKGQMDAVDYDVALIGCGAYGLPLAAHAKRTGHVSIHLGGPLQILFGIKGKRWDNIPEVAKFYNNSWVRPLPEETPAKHGAVENGCYW